MGLHLCKQHKLDLALISFCVNDEQAQTASFEDIYLVNTDFDEHPLQACKTGTPYILGGGCPLNLIRMITMRLSSRMMLRARI